MEKDAFIQICNKKEKLIRTEYEFSQEKMSSILGVSKKTLVEIEKGRSSLGWMGSVALCSLFSESEVLGGIFGGPPDDMIKALAFAGIEKDYTQTMGGTIWWKDLDVKNGYKVQQNIISKHYRILDSQSRRVCSSFDYEEMKLYLNNIEEKSI